MLCITGNTDSKYFFEVAVLGDMFRIEISAIHSVIRDRLCACIDNASIGEFYVLICIGFILNDDGWFITNNHVMEEGASAVAYFDIPDREAGDRYTKLTVIGGVYNSEEKDIFIGKLEGYEKIESYYHEIGFTESYTVGEKSYTIGYPNSSVKMEINAGVIIEISILDSNSSLIHIWANILSIDY